MSGMLGFIGIGKETGWGSGVAATDYVEAMSETMTVKIDRFTTRNIIAGLYEPDDDDGINHVEGAINFGAHPHTLGYFLNSALGSNNISTVLSGFAYTNAFTPMTTLASTQCPVPSYTIEVFKPTGGLLPSSSFRFDGCAVSKLSFDIKPNQDVLCAANIIGHQYTQITKTSPTLNTSPTAMFAFDTASVQLGGGAVDRFEQIKIDFDNLLVGVPTLNNSSLISRIRRTGAQTIRLSGVVGFDDYTDMNAFTGATEQRLVVSFTKAASFQLVFDVPRALFTTFPVAIAGRDRLTVAFDMMARYHVGSTNAIKVSLTSVNCF